jgi:hypothetical protein
MAIQSISEEWSGRSGGDDINSTEHQRKFRVVYDDADLPEVRPFIALYGGADKDGNKIPVGFEQHPFNPFLCVIRRRYEPLAPDIYDFIIDYSNRANYSANEAAQSMLMNPCDMPPDVEFINEEFTDRIDMDRDGNMIANTNDEPPDPPLMENFKHHGVRITRSQPSWEHLLMARYDMGAVNTDNFLHYGPNEVLCRRATARRMRQGLSFFWQATFEFLFDPPRKIKGEIIGKWKRRFANQSYVVRVDETMDYYRAQVNPVNDGIESDDPKWAPTPEPVFIDRDGYRTQDIMGAEVPLWLQFAFKDELPFSVFGLDGII